MLLQACAALLLLLPGPLRAQSTGTVVVDRFSGRSLADGLPEGWKPFLFKPVERRTSYRLEREGEDWFVVARSSAEGTGILKGVSLSVKEFPILSWRWMVDRVIAKGNGRKKSGDDFAARVYVSFLYEPEKAGMFKRFAYKAARSRFGGYPPDSALIYVWDSREKVGATFDNAHTGRARMIVLESGEGKAGRWVEERRDVRRDYLDAFGSEPPPVSFVALMTDTDNTGESATAWYDDLVFQ
ncbi:MAG: DUF3047 domain-containing protein [Elusimicrobia bacterium]|nr:DUF3047 domain-containing protein [Elusimicrobiota bacterium]